MSASSQYLDVLTRLETSRAANQAEAIRATAQARAGAQQANAQIWGQTLGSLGQYVAQLPQQRAELKRIENQAAETQLRREQMESEAAKLKRQDAEDQMFRDAYSRAAEEFQQGQGIETRGPDDSGQMQPTASNASLRQSPFPTPDELLKINPQRAIAQINAIAALKTPVPTDPEKTIKLLQQVGQGLMALPADQRAAVYDGLVQHWPPVQMLVQGGHLDPTYNEPQVKFFLGTAQQPEKPKAPEEFTLSPGQTRFGPDGKPIANVPAPEKPAGGESGFTLSPGQTRYGPDGKPIASRPDRPKEPAEQKRTDDLVATVLENPALWDQLTPTVRGEIAPELRARGYTNFGKPLSEAAMKQIAESNSAIDSLNDLRSVLKENEQYIGPIAGLSAMNPYSGARQAQAKIDLVRQRVGKALEGGVLRKEDEEKYKKILATLRDTPETAIYKVDQLIKNITNQVDQFKAAQRLGGRNLDLTGSNNRVPPPNGQETIQKYGATYKWDGKSQYVKQ